MRRLQEQYLHSKELGFYSNFDRQFRIFLDSFKLIDLPYCSFWEPLPY